VAPEAANLHCYSIAVSAAARITSGIVSPIALAVLRLRTSSNFAAYSTGTDSEMCLERDDFISRQNL
jgi:hypothetical protein